MAAKTGFAGFSVLLVAAVAPLVWVGCSDPPTRDEERAPNDTSTSTAGFRCPARFTPLPAKESTLDGCDIADIAPRVGTIDFAGSAVVLVAGKQDDSVIVLSAAHVRTVEQAGGEEEDPETGETSTPRPADLRPTAIGGLFLLRGDGAEGKAALALRNVYDPGGDFRVPSNDLWFLETTSPSARSIARGFRAAVVGEELRVAGVVAGGLGPRLTACRLLDDDAARAIVARLATEGDEEGTVAYDPAAEGICEGLAFSGMSGGGVFGADGYVVGTTIRASESKTKIIRFVRATHAVARLREAFAGASPAEQQHLRAVLPDTLVE